MSHRLDSPVPFLASLAYCIIMGLIIYLDDFSHVVLFTQNTGMGSFFFYLFFNLQ